MQPKFQGCYVATLTPFDASGKFDAGAAQSHAQWLVENGIEGLCPAGTTGEFLYLSHQEERELVSATVAAAQGRVPVIAGVWALTANETQDLARHAETAGANGVFLPPPIYYPASDDAIFAHYASVQKATALPVFAYNIPQHAANEISLDCLERLFTAGIIAGVKDSTGKAERVGKLVRRFGAEYTIFAASDGFAAEGRSLGADGFISAIGNAFPRLFAAIWNGETARQAEANQLRSALKQVGSISALKYLLTRQGFAFGASRLPFSDLTEAQREALNVLLD